MDRHNLDLAQSFIESQVDAAARELEARPAELAGALMMAIPLQQAQHLMMHMLPVYAAQIVKSLPLESAAKMLAEGGSNQIAAILKHLQPAARGPLLELLADRVASRCRRLLKHSDNTVGAWMSIDLLLLPSGINVSNALQRVAGKAEIGDAQLLPVVDSHRKLIGFTGIKEMLRADGSSPIKLVTRDATRLSLSSKMTLRAAAQHPGWKGQDSLVVLNKNAQPEGLLRHATLRQALSTNQDEDSVKVSEPMFAGFGQAYLGTLIGLFELTSGLSQQSNQTDTLEVEPRQ